MDMKSLRTPLLVIFYILAFVSCSYYEKIQKDAKLTKIEKSILPSSLKDANRYLGKYPLRYSFKFIFEDQQNHTFTLLFTLHDSSFPKSMLSVYDAGKSRQNIIGINQADSILKVLLKNLPHPNEINWQKFDNGSGLTYKDGYELMHDYMRFNIRDV